MRKGKTRRAKLYYMRGRVGTKSTRLREDTARIARDYQAQADTNDSEASEPAEQEAALA